MPDAARAMELELTARGVPLERAQHPEATEREVLRLQGSRQKNAYFAIAWAVLSLLFGWRWAYDGSVLGVFAAASLAIAALVLTYQAIRRFPTLTLDSEGFEVANGTPTRKYRWADCTNFHARGQFRWGSTMIGFTQYGSTLAIFNQFEASTEEICELLSKWEARYGLDRIQRSSTGAC